MNGEPQPQDPLTGRRVLVAISGSIAAVKLPLVVSALVQRGCEVRCLLSPSAERLVSAVALGSLSRHGCYLETDQWSHRAPRPLHVELAEWAELILVAPLSASSLGRWVHGLGDTLLASVLLAAEVPVVAAAAMNTAMWNSPGVLANWRALQNFPGVLPLEPTSGLLACDRRGDGRMAEPVQLLLALESLALRGRTGDWKGRRLLVSAGATREPLDPARCLTNPSTGLMGVMLAQAARLRGASVQLVHGPLALDPSLLEGLEAFPITTAAELQSCLQQHQSSADAIAMAAAVSDHRRSSPLAEKRPKSELAAELQQGWEPVPDLLAELVARRPASQPILGFAAHSGDVLDQARAKFRLKGCDLLFANPIDRPDAGFGTPTNRGWLLGPGQEVQDMPLSSKFVLAHRLVDALGALLRRPEAGDAQEAPAAADP